MRSFTPAASPVFGMPYTDSARAGQAVATMTETLLDVAAELEARLDHPDDDLSLKSDEAVAEVLAALTQQAEGLATSWTSSKVRQAGATVAIVGPVNAGKSSLFNTSWAGARACECPARNDARCGGARSY